MTSDVPLADEGAHMTVKTSPRPADLPLANHEQLNAERWAWRFDLDGVLADFTGTAFRVGSSGASRSVTIGAVGDRCVVRGHMGRITTPEVHDLSQLGTQPTGSQERFSRIVARFHLAGALLNTITVVPIVGSAAAAGATVTPSFLRSLEAYDLPLAIVRQRGSAAIDNSDLTDERVRVGPGGSLYAPDSVTVETSAFPLGTVVERDTYRQKRILINGSPGWRYFDETDINWVTSDAAVNPQRYSGNLAWRRRSGWLSVQFELQRLSDAPTVSAQTVTYLTLPAGSRPTRNCFGWVQVGGTTSYRTRVGTDGTVTIIGLSINAGQSLTGSVSFPL